VTRAEAAAFLADPGINARLRAVGRDGDYSAGAIDRAWDVLTLDEARKWREAVAVYQPRAQAYLQLIDAQIARKESQP